MKKLISSSVIGASILLVIFSGISRVVGFVREVVFASNFGLSNHYDIYLIASVIPITINTILLFIGQNFFIPSFIELETTDKLKLNHLLSISVLSFLIIGSIISLVLYFFVPVMKSLFMSTNEDSTEFGITRLGF